MRLDAPFLGAGTNAAFPSFRVDRLLTLLLSLAPIVLLLDTLPELITLTYYVVASPSNSRNETERWEREGSGPS